MMPAAIIAAMFRPGRCRGRAAFAVMLWALAATTGCQSAAQQRKLLSSPDPVGRVRAAVWLAESGDTQALHQLVGMLEERDRAARMYAILALRRLTGETYGYRYYAPEPQRRRAVLRWQEALRRGELRVRTTRQAGTASQDSAAFSADGPGPSQHPASAAQEAQGP
jgi:hypothetical protein